MRIRAVQYKALQQGANRTATAHLVVQMIRCVLENPGDNGLGREPIRLYLKIMLNVGQKYASTWERRQLKIRDEIGLKPGNTTRHKLYKTSIPALAAVLVELDDWPCSDSGPTPETQGQIEADNLVLLGLWKSYQNRHSSARAAARAFRKEMEALPGFVSMLPDDMTNPAEVLNLAYQYIVRYRYPAKARGLSSGTFGRLLPRSLSSELVRALLVGDQASVRQVHGKVVKDLADRSVRHASRGRRSGGERRSTTSLSSIFVNTLETIEKLTHSTESADLWDTGQLQSVIARELIAVRQMGATDDGPNGAVTDSE